MNKLPNVDVSCNAHLTGCSSIDVHGLKSFDLYERLAFLDGQQDNDWQSDGRHACKTSYWSSQ